MSKVVRLKQGSSAFHLALDMVGALNGGETPILPDRPLPGRSVTRSVRPRSSENNILYFDRARSSGGK